MILTIEDALRWMDAMTRVVSLPISPASREGVAEQLALNYRLVAPLLDFELLEDLPPASVREP